MDSTQTCIFIIVQVDQIKVIVGIKRAKNLKTFNILTMKKIVYCKSLLIAIDVKTILIRHVFGNFVLGWRGNKILF